VTRAGGELRLTTKEAQLLAYLVRHSEVELSRETLLGEVWGYGPGVVTRTLDSTVQRLRAKIEIDPSVPRHVITVHGVGYRFLFAGAAPPSKLPASSTRFVGRDEELARLDRLVVEQATRSVTLLGPPGIGKSRFALEYARHWLDRRGEQAWAGIVDLEGAVSGDSVVASAAATLGVPLLKRGEGAGVVQLARVLAERGPALLVLDHIERARDALQDVLARWLDLAPETAFLVASRERLRLAGEVLFELEALDPRAAVELFRDRFHAVHAGSVAPLLDDSTGRAIAEQLEGVPLAIELAAARGNAFTSEELLKRLSTWAAAGDGTLQAAIAFSWDLLAPAERTALAQCAVFRGGFGLASVEAVIDLGDQRFPSDPLEVVAALRDKSLLRFSMPPQTPGEWRYSIFEVIREFAEGRLLKSGAAAATRRRHAVHFVDLGERLGRLSGGPGGAAADRRLALETENLLAAHSAALESDHQLATRAALVLEDPLVRGGPLDELERILSRSLDAGEKIARRLRARALRARGSARRIQGRLNEAREDLLAALELARGLPDERLEAVALGNLGAVDHESGRLGAAAERFGQALELFAETGNRSLEGIYRANLARAAHDLGRKAEAEQGYREALALFLELGDQGNEGSVRGSFGVLLRDQGRTDEAREELERALSIHRESGNIRAEAVALAGLGVVSELAGRAEEALERYSEAAKMARRLGDRRTEGLVLAQLAEAVAATEGRSRETDTLLFDALRAIRDCHNPRLEASLLARIGDLRAATGHLHEAEARLRQGLALACELTAARDSALIRCRLAAVLADADRLDQANAELRRAAEEGEQDDDLKSVQALASGHLHLAQARQAEGAGDTLSAQRHRADAQQTLEEIRTRFPQDIHPAGPSALRSAMRRLADKLRA